MLDGLIFDVDGTLWDSTDLVAKAWNYVLETETNLPADVTGDLLKTLFGKPMDEICLKIFKGIPVSEHPRLGDICFQKENQLLYRSRCRFIHRSSRLFRNYPHAAPFSL